MTRLDQYRLRLGVDAVEKIFDTAKEKKGFPSSLEDCCKKLEVPFVPVAEAIDSMFNMIRGGNIESEDDLNNREYVTSTLVALGYMLALKEFKK